MYCQKCGTRLAQGDTVVLIMRGIFMLERKSEGHDAMVLCLNCAPSVVVAEAVASDADAVALAAADAVVGLGAAAAVALEGV